jgi:hypothetical protein
MKHEPSDKRTAALRGLAVAGMLLAVTATDAGAGFRVRKTLTPTVANPSAQGLAAVSVGGRGRGTTGRLDLSLRKLAPQRQFTVRVAGVTVGSFTTNVRGSGRARFSTRPGRGLQPLGIDPRGQRVTVADDQDEDELETDVPDDSPNPCCCVDSTRGGADGKEVDENECENEHGAAPGSGSCLPDPCNPPAEDIRCCIPEEHNVECELTSIAGCTAHNGVNMGAGSCDSTTCPQPPPPTVTRCCIPDEDEGEGDDHGGAGRLECEHLSVEHCAAEHGADKGPGSCEPSPCVASPSGAFLEKSASLF